MTPKGFRVPFPPVFPRSLAALAALLFLAPSAFTQVVINEIHYHPVEEPAFNLDGTPVLDLSSDIHEFVEIHNAGPTEVNLGGWKLDDGITFTFPANTTIPAGGYKVIAKNVARLMAVYPGLTGVLGPYAGQLSNSGETIKLKDSAGGVVDSVSYSASFPWAISADALGAGSDFHGINRYQYQYKGRSLERVSVSGGSNDAANWLASPLPAGPSPGAANAVVRAVPKPVVVAFSVLQNADESPVIRAAQPVKVDVTFSSVEGLGSVQLEWFVDDINSTSEPRNTIAMNALGNGRFTVSTAIPGQANRSIIRWRIKADRGEGVEIVSPRPDDPQIAAVGPGGAREAWHGYFVEPVRSSTKPIYDFFISNANAAILDSNGAQDPRRVLPTGYPRDDPKKGYYPPNANYNPANYPTANAPHWDGVVPAVFVRSGVVHDIVARYHGSRYQRSGGKNAWKFSFPAYRLMDGKQRILVTEKDNRTVLGLALFREAGLPASYSQFVDFYKNGNGAVQRCEIGDPDEETVKQYQREQVEANPQNPPVFEGRGIIYKSKGLDGNEGPYGWANGQPLPAASPWSILDRYIHSFPSQLEDWRGALPMKTMVDALWTARGDRAQLAYPDRYANQSHSNQSSVAVNLTTLRAYLNANWDVDKMLSYLAIRNWGSPWDDKFHNHYVYLQPDNRWTMIPWDFDNEMSGGATGESGYANSIFAGRKDDTFGSYSNNYRGPNWFKDSILRAFEAEYRQRVFLLNNTLLSPANVQAVAAANGVSVPDINWLNNRFANINTQVNLGGWHSPAKPANLTPSTGSGTVPPSTFTTSAYGHSSGSTGGVSAHAQTRWEIRRADRTYRQPVYNVTSTTDLVSLPIPFTLLEFGQTYYWRVTYYDSSGRPSAPSDETSFGFGPRPSEVTLINFSDTWKYNYTSSFSDSTWAQPAFNDTSWASGAGALAFETDGIPAPATINTVLPDPRTLSPSGRAYYFRKKFNFPGNPATSTIRIRHLIDDGCVIWINGQRVHRYLMNDQANYATANFSTSTPPTGGEAGYQYADAISGTDTWAYVDPRPFLVQGENVIAVEVHQNNSSSTDIVFALEMTGTVITSGGDVALNEVLADNRSGVLNGTSRPDYVEIRNNTAAEVSLSGWSLSDNVLNPNKYAFPAGTAIPAGGRLVVWCDSNFTDPGLHTGFGLSRNGQTVVLFQGTNVRDYVVFGPQVSDLPIGRVPDGVGSWTLIAPSPGAANVAQPLGSTATLKVNEWMASPGTGEDWFELYNPASLPVRIGELWLSDTPGKALTQIPALSFIAAKGYTRFEADGLATGGNHAAFKLSASGDNLILYASNGTTILDSISFGSQGLNVSEGRFPDGAATRSTFPGTASPGASNWKPAPVVINEALSNSVSPLVDQIELYNPTASAVNIGNWWLSDDEYTPRKYQIAAGTTIPAGGYLVFTEAHFNTGSKPFALSSMGDEIILTAVDGSGADTGFRAQVKFGAAAENTSFGRILTGGQPEFWPLVERTFGSANAAPVIGPVLINEVHYHPPNIGTADNTRDEFIELHNPTTSAVGIGGWRLKGGTKFTFPSGTILRPGDYVLVVGFDPADTATLNAFRSNFALPASVPIYGPYSPKLSNSTAVVEIAYPGTPVNGVTPYINVDKVEYTDFAPWPAAADGSGSSLQRQSRAIIGNDVANWIAALPTPGRENTGQEAILDNDGDGIPNAWEDLYGLDKFNAADALLDSDGDGQSNLAEYLAGTSPIDSTDRLEAEVTTSSEPGFTIHFQAKAGKTYTIRYKSSPTDAAWTKLIDIPAGAERPIEHTDPTTEPRRFYQVITPQQ